MLYDVEKNRKPVPNGAVDPRLVSIYTNFLIVVAALTSVLGYLEQDRTM